MNNELEIIEISKSHFEQVKDLLVELQKYVIEIDKYHLNILSSDYRDKYFEYMIHDCKLNDGKVFVALQNDAVLGMIAGYVERYSDRDKLDYACPKKGIIAELIVAKNSRKDGVGTKLLSKMEEYFKTIGCEYIQIDVFAYNENAKKFYYNKGYDDRMITVFKKIEK